VANATSTVALWVIVMPERAFAQQVPFLLLVAMSIFSFGDRLRAALARRFDTARVKRVVVALG
jgi:hypothetical protein